MSLAFYDMFYPNQKNNIINVQDNNCISINIYVSREIDEQIVEVNENDIEMCYVLQMDK